MTTTPQTPSNKSLWDRFRQGDKLAFSELYQTYFNNLYDYGVRHTQKPELTIDCIQDFFLYLWNHRENLQSAHSVKYYLLTSFRRRLFRNLEKERKKQHQKRDISLAFEIAEHSFENNLIADEEAYRRSAQIKLLLQNLSPRQKEIVYLRYYQKLSPQEISETVGIRYQTVVNHLCEAIKALRRHQSESHFLMAS
jgi:RNA polymerase sigma factor (sigma-70 family)